MSESTEKRDPGVKFEDYETHGVVEYWIIDAEKPVLEQYVIGQDGHYELRVKSATGELVSPVLGGLTLSIKDLLKK